MRVISAHVRSGAIVPDEEQDLAEGTAVTVLADSDEKTFEVSMDEEAALVAALEEADRGEVVSAAAVLRRLGR
jgi:hypothetical protein